MGTLQTWRKAYGALKDTTKVGLAHVNSDYADLDVAIVKATNHVECPQKDFVCHGGDSATGRCCLLHSYTFETFEQDSQLDELLSLSETALSSLQGRPLNQIRE